MPKAKRETATKKTPYARQQGKDKKTSIKNKKPLTKSEKLKNANLTEDLDNILEDLQQHLTPKKKKLNIKNDSMEDTSKLEEEQRLYEKTQDDMDAALGLLTKL
ncbi:hypothetical protein CU098_002320 [Rhizopus stolonifer]|uniref:Uncharacterized protein n=1 Tax=Rhizopus stolonifer TaxID=4846 RepID=A0A367KVM6_RHIST|nr:hypothetical protein CU098_002320 [Rhizopus stolonifer]